MANPLSVGAMSLTGTRFEAAARRHGRWTYDHVLEDRARGALLGTFAGDALGSPFDGRRRAAVRARELAANHARLARREGTAATTTMVALASSLLRHDAIDADDLGHALAAQLAQANRGDRPIGEDHPSAVHAAAAVAPLSIRFSDHPLRRIDEQRRAARVARLDGAAQDAAWVQTTAIAAAIEGDEPVSAAVAAASSAELRDALLRCAAATDSDLSPETLPVPSSGVAARLSRAVPVAILVAARARSFQHAITTAVACGGACGAVTAMTGAVAGARFGADGIPIPWSAALSDDRLGRRHVESQAIELARRARQDARR